MGLTFEGWKANWGLPLHQSMDGCVFRLPTNECFRLASYVRKMSERSIPLAQSRPRLLDFVQRTGRNKPINTLRSIVSEEYEAVARAAAVHWGRTNGHEVYSLQHDGIQLGWTRATTSASVASSLTRVVSQA